jgi:hypothetical protein
MMSGSWGGETVIGHLLVPERGMGTLYYCHGIVMVLCRSRRRRNRLQQPGPAEATHRGAEGGFAHRNCSSSHVAGVGCLSSMLQASIVWASTVFRDLDRQY